MGYLDPIFRTFSFSELHQCKIPSDAPVIPRGYNLARVSNSAYGVSDAETHIVWLTSVLSTCCSAVYKGSQFARSLDLAARAFVHFS